MVPVVYKVMKEDILFVNQRLTELQEQYSSAR